MNKYLKNILYSFIIILILYTYLSTPKCVSREEGVCTAIGSLENYVSLLDYDTFKNAKVERNRNIPNYEILADYMDSYNRECKEYNVTEDKIIDNNLRKIKEALSGL